MNSEILQSKARLRAEMLATLHRMPVQERLSASAQVCARVQQWAIWQQAKAVFFYAPSPEEVDIWPLLAIAKREGKHVVLPRFVPASRAYEGAEVEDLDTDIVVGHFSIREPKRTKCTFPLNRLDLSLVPGLVFDGLGSRLGRGRGYYDRLLMTVSGIKCGIGWDAQLIPEVPVLAHDIKLDCILTPGHWFFASQTRSANEFTGK